MIALIYIQAKVFYLFKYFSHGKKLRIRSSNINSLLFLFTTPITMIRRYTHTHTYAYADGTKIREVIYETLTNYTRTHAHIDAQSHCDT